MFDGTRPLTREHVWWPRHLWDMALPPLVSGADGQEVGLSYLRSSVMDDFGLHERRRGGMGNYWEHRLLPDLAGRWRESWAEPESRLVKWFYQPEEYTIEFAAWARAGGHLGTIEQRLLVVLEAERYLTSAGPVEWRRPSQHAWALRLEELLRSDSIGEDAAIAEAIELAGRLQENKLPAGVESFASRGRDGDVAEGDRITPKMICEVLDGFARARANALESGRESLDLAKVPEHLALAWQSREVLGIGELDESIVSKERRPRRCMRMTWIGPSEYFALGRGPMWIGAISEQIGDFGSRVRILKPSKARGQLSVPVRDAASGEAGRRVVELAESPKNPSVSREWGPEGVRIVGHRIDVRADDGAIVSYFHDKCPIEGFMVNPFDPTLIAAIEPSQVIVLRLHR